MSLALAFHNILLLVIFCGATAAIATNRSTTEQQHEQGRAIYNYRCYFCHGYSGDAKTLASTFLTPPPRNFTQTGAEELSRRHMIDVVTSGKPGTAMHGFSRLLNMQEIVAVVDFVHIEFITNQRANTRYHTPENGWPNHDRYILAFPFATGSIPLDRAWEQLTPQQSRGKQLFLTSCITCHDRATVTDEGEIWSKQSISYPRNNYSHTVFDAVSSASIYARHDLPPTVENLSTEAAKGKQLWQQNCAFCHAADGTSENWIGSFLEPKPRNLTDEKFMSEMTREILLLRIKHGIKNTSMPAWENVLSENQIQQIISYIDQVFYSLKRE